MHPMESMLNLISGELDIAADLVYILIIPNGSTIMIVYIACACRASAIAVAEDPLLPRARMREAGLSNGFCPSVCQSVSQSVSVSSKFWADHDNEGSKRF